MNGTDVAPSRHLTISYLLLLTCRFQFFEIHRVGAMSGVCTHARGGARCFYEHFFILRGQQILIYRRLIEWVVGVVKKCIYTYTREYGTSANAFISLFKYLKANVFSRAINYNPRTLRNVRTKRP